MSIGIYIHIPFCQAKCPYCDFYSVVADESVMERYTQAVLRALAASPYPLRANSLYFGGGTPTLLGAERLNRIVAAIPTEPQAEITLEANPKSVTQSLLNAVCAGGFNRISIGVQSTQDEILKTLGRSHTLAEARQTVDWAAEAGFKHISVDLMLAVPGQTATQVLLDVAELTSWPIDHISAYLLKIEPQTPFYTRFKEPLEELSVDCYLTAVEQLEKQGFLQYEISNFAKSAAAQSRHNLKYWHCAPYLGIGPAAHSMMENKRFFFPREVDRFMAAQNPWALAVADGEGNTVEEQLLLGLRLTEGVAWPSEKPIDPRLFSQGLARWENGRLALTAKGFLISNTIIASLL